MSVIGGLPPSPCAQQQRCSLSSSPPPPFSSSAASMVVSTPTPTPPQGIPQGTAATKHRSLWKQTWYVTPNLPLGPPSCLRSSGDGGGDIRARLLPKLNRTLQTRRLLQRQQKVLVAVSGGQDSISLIFLLKELQHLWDWRLGIVHCDHQWSHSSRPQASHVAQVACYLGIEYYQAVATRDVTGETAARAWRYGVMYRIARCHGYTAIVTAHTASDRVETLLHNLFRGSGLRGLLSLTWKRSLPVVIDSRSGEQEGMASPDVELVRPLLDISRMELREFCAHQRLPLFPDPSNFSLEIKRNRIRHQLLPFLRKRFQLSVDRSLARWAEILHGEDDFLEGLCRSIRKESEFSFDDGEERMVTLNVNAIRSSHVAIQRRVIKQFVESFSEKSLGFDQVEHLRVTCLAQPCRNGLCFSLPGNVVLQYEDDNFLLRKKKKT